MEYIKGPWSSKEYPPKGLDFHFTHHIYDPYGTIVAKLNAGYIPAPDTPDIESYLNLWRNTARVIKYAPDMYKLLKKIQDGELDSLKAEIDSLMDKVDGRTSALEALIKEKESEKECISK